MNGTDICILGFCGLMILLIYLFIIIFTIIIVIYFASRKTEEKNKGNRNEFKIPEIHFKCPYCGYKSTVLKATKISSAGWIVFVLLLLFFLPLCWIGFLITEKYEVCSKCKHVLSKEDYLNNKT
ncbi:MAG: LITAF-like zinc ribbon domain-containing protein [Candidatus Thermoplasmatota archaeon]|nr:LITAF-like zinc ribbon domain-containing protein [Candidatus Thermoplasmatota archaeon]